MKKRYSISTIAGQMVMYWRRGDFDDIKDEGLHKMLCELAQAVDAEDAEMAARREQVRRALKAA